MVIWIDTLYADTVAESVADVHHYVPAVHLQKEEIVLKGGNGMEIGGNCQGCA